MGKSTISMAIFNSFLYVYQRVDGWDSLIYGTQPSRMYNGSSTTSHSGDLVSAGRHSLSQLGWRELFRKLRVGISTYGYGSIPIHTIFSGMNIHKSQLFWCELQGFSRFWHTATYLYPAAIQCGHGKSNVVREIFFWGPSLVDVPLPWEESREWSWKAIPFPIFPYKIFTSLSLVVPPTWVGLVWVSLSLEVHGRSIHY